MSSSKVPVTNQSMILQNWLWGTSEFISLSHRAEREGLQARVWVALKQPQWKVCTQCVCPLLYDCIDAAPFPSPSQPIYLLLLLSVTVTIMEEFHRNGWKNWLYV